MGPWPLCFAYLAGRWVGQGLCTTSESLKELMYLGSGYKYFTDSLKTIINVAPVGSLGKRGDDR